MEEKKLELLNKVKKLLDEVEDLEIELALFENDNNLDKKYASQGADFAWDELLNVKNVLENLQ